MRPERVAPALLAAFALACAAGESERAHEVASPVSPSPGRGTEIHFERRTLSTDFTCEGAHFADLDKDGHMDVVAGPYWYRGPDFGERHELMPPVVVDPAGYSQQFFVWPWDVDGDGWIDLVRVGFPGKEAEWLRNPRGRTGRHWERFLIHDAVDNESPVFTDLTGDGIPELVFHTGGRFGFAAPRRADPREPWVFRAVSRPFEIGRFNHGLGVGDVDGDGRADILWREGWLQQPPSIAGNPMWDFHPFRFGTQGGAQMFVRDVDGDGDGDVITGLAAHGFGLSWFEQVPAGEGITFLEHRLMGETPAESPHGVCFAELHALDVADVDGDGLDDIVTGKRWWSHGAKGDPQPGSEPIVAWFRLVRGAGGPDFVPQRIDGTTGVGVQLTTGDVDGDGLRDVVIGSKRGVHVLLQRRETPEELAARLATQGPTLDFEEGDLRGWTATGDAFALQPICGDTVTARDREPSLHEGAFWIGGHERLGDKPKGTLTSDLFHVEHPWASFLVGGGASEQTRVELVLEEGERVLFRTGGANHESMQRVVADLRPYAGKRIRIRLVDNASGGWGHINFDDFRFHPERPAFERPAGVPAILPFDEVAHAGLPAHEAARAMRLPEGFQVDVIAAEPELHQPIALTVDDRGRLWVAEAFAYPKRRPGMEGPDDIVVFEDRDADGRFETRTVFLSGLNLVSGLEVGFGGVWIGAAPYLMFVPDADGDLVPDGDPEILLDGWGYEDTHETLNAFTWGPDGWLYGCHGVFTHSRVGKPGTPDEAREPLNAGLWRFHPTRREFEVFAWGTSNPWGVDFDARGQAFLTACVIPHLYHAVQGGRYLRQAGSHFGAHVYADIDTIADHRHYVGATPHGGNNRSDATGGGHAHCGLLIYGETAFPAEHRGALYFGNIHGNRINTDRVERAGSGFVGRHGPDFLLANDRWFRGINLRAGPSGEIYLIDWYDQQACHLTSPEIWDRTNGRLYRISHGAPRPARVDMGALTSAELALQVFAPGEWHARRARRLLQERGRNEAVEAVLRERLAVRADDGAPLRALWALHGMGALDETLARTALGSPHEYVRAWAVQLVLEDRQVEPETLALMEALAAQDPSPVVRLYLASALQRLPLEQRWSLAQSLCARGEDDADANIPLLLWYGIEPLVEADPVRALGHFAHGQSHSAMLERVRRFVVRRAAASPSMHGALVHALISSYPAHTRWMLEETLAGLADQRGLAMPAGWPQLHDALRQHGDREVAELAASLAVAFGDPTALPGLRATLADPEATPGARVQALESLVRARDPEAAPLLRPLLDEPELAGPAIRALAVFDDAEGARALLGRYGRLGVEDRRDTLNTLSSRASYAALLLDGVESGAIPRSDLGAFVARKLESLGDAAVAARLEALWGRVRPTSESRAARIAELTAALTPEALAAADRSAGRALFARTCQQCHTLFETGGTVGPDLTGSNRADLSYLLSNVVDPNAVVGKDYLATMVWTHDGRLVTGIQRSENETTVTLQTENETLVVPREEIETLRLSDLSTMPEGLLDPLRADEIRDLVAYLQGATQVPLAAQPGDARRLFDGASLRGWSGDPSVWSVRDGAIVGRTEEGLAHNAFLASELELRDFRLDLEVLLVDDRGNSGIQFRSRVLEDGDVAGYQADIGPGWWGKLYEEHGRGLLWDRSGEAHVRKGEWNRYRIEARGHRLRTWINGQPCVDLEDQSGALRGVLALQVHSGGPTEVRFRGLVLELLE